MEYYCAIENDLRILLEKPEDIWADAEWNEQKKQNSFYDTVKTNSSERPKNPDQYNSQLLFQRSHRTDDKTSTSWHRMKHVFQTQSCILVLYICYNAYFSSSPFSMKLRDKRKNRFLLIKKIFSGLTASWGNGLFFPQQSLDDCSSGGTRWPFQAPFLLWDYYSVPQRVVMKNTFNQN